MQIAPPAGFELITAEELIVNAALLFDEAFVPSPAKDAASEVAETGSVNVAVAIPLAFVVPEPVEVPRVNVTVLFASGKKFGPDLNSNVA